VKNCIMCGRETEGSMDGPYVCGFCDSGCRPDGTQFTYEDATAYYRRVTEWRKAWSEGDPDRAFTPIFAAHPDAEEGA
jgi:hypothetical protein